MSEENKVIEEIKEEAEKAAEAVKENADEAVEAVKQEIDFSDQNEPFNSIEKTVTDLKKKFQDLTEEKPEDEGEAEIPDFINAEKKEAEDLTKKAEKIVSDSIEVIRENTSKILDNPELKKTIDYIKDNAVKAVDTAKAKADELASAPKAEEFKEKTSAALDKAKEFASEAGKTITESTQKAIKEADAFLNKPEVKKNVDMVVGAVSEAAKKVSDTVAGLVSSIQKKSCKIEDEDAAAEAIEEAEMLKENICENAEETAEEVCAQAEEASEEEQSEE